MGGSYYSSDDMKARSSLRSTDAARRGISHTDATFAHSYAIKTGATAAAVHKLLKPSTKPRESRDSDAHPVTVPIGVICDTTGSMHEVPIMMQKDLSRLMGIFLEDKASGKKYLGDGYPAILIGAVDDYRAMGGEGCLQIAEFESGIEIDDALSNLWMTGNGGGTYEESYELALYFFARHTAHDHFEKRGRKGYLFLIGDEHAYPHVSREQIQRIIGAGPQADVPLKDIIAEVQQRYHVFFVIPNLTSHYSDTSLHKYWQDLLGQQNILLLEDPHKICELIASTVALCEEFIGIDDLEADGLGDHKTALVPLARVGAELSKYSAAGLPSLAGSGGVERL